jgi:tetratricopeptide (TPR) repeat protein
MSAGAAAEVDAASRLITDVESLRRTNPESALEALSRGFAIALRGATPDRRGELWRVRGHVLRSLRRLRPAVDAYRRAEQWYGRAGNRGERGRCAIGLVDALMYLGRYREAEREAERGRQDLKRAGDWAAEARLLNNQGNLYHRTDRPALALESYQRARGALARAGDERGRGLVAGNVANCLSLLGRLGEARKLYLDSRQASVRGGFMVDALNADYNLAYLEFLDQRHERALEDLERVRGTARGAGVPGIAALSGLDRAEILLRLGAHAEALAEAREASSAFVTLGMTYERAKAETFAALAEFRLGRYRQAQLRLERALDAFVSEGNAVWTGETLVGLGTLWWSQGEVAAAAPMLAAAARRFAWAKDQEREGCARALLVRACLEAGTMRQAAAQLARARALSRGGRSVRLRHLVWVAAAELAWRRGELARARRALSRAALESERLAARILDEQWRASFWAEWGVPHQELAALELRAGRTAEAFEALERGRGRALASRRRGRRRQLPPQVRSWAAAELARDRDRTSRGSSVATVSAPPAPVRLRRLLEHRAATPLVRVSDLTGRLTEGVCLLDYFEHRGQLGAFRATAGELEVRTPLAPRAQLDRLAHEALFELRRAAFERGERDRSAAALDEALTELASLILWPLVRLGELPRTLAVVPVAPLNRLPWAALPLPDGRRLGEVIRIVIVPGLRLGLARASLRPVGRASEGHGLIVASAAEGLDQVGEEAAAVRASQGPAVLLDGARASAAEFLQQAPRASWIHFAGHGFFQDGSAGLKLSDRWVLADELEALRLSARWVSLSACQTARALVQPGEEWFGLSRSLLLAGAGAVLAAQWDVEDAAAAGFMSAVYRHLSTGVTLGEALSQTQRTAAAGGRHPLEWAGFVLLGGPGAAEVTR